MKSSPFLHLACFIAITSSTELMAQHDYDLTLEPSHQPFQYTVSSFLGAIDGDDTFYLSGISGLEVSNPTAPFGQCVIKGSFNGDIYADPNLQYNYISNPIPTLPPILETWLHDFAFYLLSTPFTPDPVTGNFQSTGLLTCTVGWIDVILLGTSTSWIVAGSGTNSFPMNGNLSQFGGKIKLNMPLTVSWFGDLSGLPISVNSQGVLAAETTIAGVSPALHVSSLTGGQMASFDFTGGLSQSPTWLAASLLGPGTTPIPPLHVDAGLLNPILLGTGMSDVNATFSWNLQVPNQPGLNVWFQAVQMGLTTSVIATTIQ